MLDVQRMSDAYIEAIYFTETGDLDQPPATAELTALCRCQVYTACRLFSDSLREAPWPLKLDALDAAQLGHDLWLTRNGHGTGFWDRPEIYGQATAELFTMVAKAMGEHDAEFDVGETSH